MSRFERQSFLGVDSEPTLNAAMIGLVGLGGGGSHIVQQTAHLGIGGYTVVDPDHITDTNTNRLIGGTLADLAPATSKVAIAKRQILGLVEHPRIIPVKDSWHNAINELKACDIIIGAVDSFIEREQLERFARRHLIPYIDIGMDVHKLAERQFLISGQVIRSMPGRPCLRCCGLITDESLRQEAGKYGAAGSRPQVVWSNGVLASTAIGLITQLLTPWFNEPPDFVYLNYDGNKGTITPNDRMTLLKGRVCSHHPNYETGDPMFDVREFNRLRSNLMIDHATSLVPSKRRKIWTRLADVFGRNGGNGKDPANSRQVSAPARESRTAHRANKKSNRMQDYSIERQGIPNLDFTGEIIGQSGGQPPRVKIYRTKGLKFVGEIKADQKMADAQAFDKPVDVILWFRRMNRGPLSPEAQDAVEDATKHDDGFKAAWNEHIN